MNHPINLPALAYVGKEKSKLTLHLFLQIIGKIRLGQTARKNHWWYITEYISTRGLTTGPVPYDNGTKNFTITLNVLRHTLEVENTEGAQDSFDLAPGLTVADFYRQLTGILEKQEITYDILAKPFDLKGIDQGFDQITDYHHYDPDYTFRLWKILTWIDAVFKEFSGRFYGKTCPVHLYWHSMDLTVTRFSGREAPPMPEDARISDKDAYSHEVISFGFWPGDDTVKEPAFYSYTYPSPEGLDQEPISPASAEWVDNNGSPMAYLGYADLLKEKDPRSALLAFLETSYQAGAKLAGWDLEHFTVKDLEAL
ncbi:DUF5996 family protein [Neolewinella antarctica]|uniref:Ava_C0101 and related proteins n=1 Tax=Neolewinella antarctica TaxID=442734 RepID=A0ABX0XD00_9BACT|nr:DUF5996 family protein [Neolewinella antarctica]NJC27173.1 hypothetical protein [Neolewinella antarctica]